ncbi:MAG: DUF4332 domain-containing protein [Cyclobacteriaceae bacterium]
MSYYRDLKDISIEQYKQILRSADMIPSWMVLKENIDECMEAIKDCDIQNLDELKTAVKNKDKVQEFAQQSGLSIDYLSVLRRVVNGYHPKPNRIKDFPNISEETVAKLQELGYKNTLQLYDAILTKEKRKKLSLETGISIGEIRQLGSMTDLSRIRWVNHTFAYVLKEAGYDSAESVASADYQEMYETIIKLNREREIYKGNIGAHDMKLCVEAAQGLDFEIEF